MWIVRLALRRPYTFTVMAVLISSRESPVGEAPPLTKLSGESASAWAGAGQPPPPGAIGPDIEPEPVS